MLLLIQYNNISVEAELFVCNEMQSRNVTAAAVCEVQVVRHASVIPVHRNHLNLQQHAPAAALASPIYPLYTHCVNPAPSRAHMRGEHLTARV